ncbi:MAG TPA: hypothetical protein VIG04_06445 [Gemmatimonadales bacterium]|jgi:hypothetical protein
MLALTLLLGFLLTAGSLGCEGPRREPPLEDAALNAGLDPKNPRIRAVVDYFETQGVELVHDSGGWWRVTRPAPPDFDVIVSLRSFPERASAYQMRDALSRINLSYLLNADARVAMSYPGLRGAQPGAITDVRIGDLQTRLERLFRAYRPDSAYASAQGMTTQWKSVVYAHHAGGTGAGSLRARTSDLIHLSSPRHVAIRAVFRYDPETEAWRRLALEPLPAMTLTVAAPRQIYSAESDQVLLTIPLPVGLFWALWEEDGHRLASAIYAGPILCEDVMLGPAPPGRLAMCVPFADRAEARFVPDPSRL